MPLTYKSPDWSAVRKNNILNRLYEETNNHFDYYISFMCVSCYVL